MCWPEILSSLLEEKPVGIMATNIWEAESFYFLWTSGVLKGMVNTSNWTTTVLQSLEVLTLTVGNTCPVAK